MLHREDFYEIFKRTYESFSEENGSIRAIEYCDNAWKGGWVSFERLNVITTRSPELKHLAYTLSEYNLKGGLLKYLAGKVVVYAFMLSGGILSDKTFDIKGNNGVKESHLIWPCNRSIRIFDFKHNTVTSVLKDGFPSAMLRTSLQFRLGHDFSFLPPLLNHGKNWFMEPILPGRALARIRSNRQYEEASAAALSYMKLIADETAQRVSASVYADNQVKQITKKLATAISQKHIATEKKIYTLVDSALRLVKIYDNEIVTALTHGDLQPGNIWVDPQAGKVYILDWETLAIRSIWYDPATLLCSLRKRNGFETMIKMLKDKVLFNRILDMDDKEDYNSELVIAIILLENISFYLDDLLSLPGDYGAESFDQAVDSIYVATINLREAA